MWRLKKSLQVIPNSYGSSGGTGPGHPCWFYGDKACVVCHHSSPLSRLHSPFRVTVWKMWWYISALWGVHFVGVGEVVVQDNTRFNDTHSFVWMELNWSSQNSPPCSHDAKGILLWSGGNCIFPCPWSCSPLFQKTQSINHCTTIIGITNTL